MIKNRYQILQILSQAGGFGETFLAEDTDTPSHRRCVIKKLRPVADATVFKFAQERFHREAAILEKLGDSCDQIPKLYAYFVENQEFYLVQELIEGLTLRQKLQQDTLDENTIGGLLWSLLNVLEYIHRQKIIHRDIKPDNVIIRRRDNKPVLIDFGIVKEVLHVGTDGNPTSSIVAGTPGYIAPEQAAGRPVFASDIYSLGATAIYLLTQKNPRQMTDSVTGDIVWQQFAPQVSANFAAVINKAAELHTKDRYKTVAEMREDLRRVSRGEQITSAQPSLTINKRQTIVKTATPRTLIKQPKRSNYVLYLGGAVIVGFFVIITLMLLLLNLNRLTGNKNTLSEEEYFEIAIKCERNRNYNCSIENFTKAIQLNPKNAISYFNRGVSYIENVDFDRAIIDFTTAIELKPDYADAYFNRGNIYDRKGNYDEAIRDFTAVIKLDPNNAKAYGSRGAVYGTKKNSDEAIKDFTAAIKLNPNYADNYLNRGTAYSTIRDFDKAVADYREVLRIDPNNQSGKDLLARVLAEKKEK